MAPRLQQLVPPNLRDKASEERVCTRPSPPKTGSGQALECRFCLEVVLIIKEELWVGIGAYFIILCFVPFRKDVSDGPMERQVDFGCWKRAVGITAVEGEHRA